MSKLLLFALLFFLGCTVPQDVARNKGGVEGALEYYRAIIAPLEGVSGFAIDSSESRPVLKIFLRYQSIEALGAIPDSIGSVPVSIIIEPISHFD